MDLEDIKDTYIVHLAGYAAAAKISMDPAFASCAPHNLKKRNHIFPKMKYKYWLKIHKFRIKVRKNTKQ